MVNLWHKAPPCNFSGFFFVKLFDVGGLFEGGAIFNGCSLFFFQSTDTLLILPEHICSIIASMMRNCQGTLRQRLLLKFTENDHEKVCMTLTYSACIFFVLF